MSENMGLGTVQQVAVLQQLSIPTAIKLTRKVSGLKGLMYGYLGVDFSYVKEYDCY